MTVIIDGSPLTIEDVVSVANGRTEVEVGSDLAERMNPALHVVRSAVAGDQTMCGITRGALHPILSEE